MYAKFITIFHLVQEIGPFSIWSSAKPLPMKNFISQSLWLDLEILLISMFTQKVIKIFHSVQEIGLFSLFLDFEPRQRLGKSQMTFDNPLGYILSISMHMQNFINIQNGLRVIHIFQNKPGTKSSQTVQGQHLHNLSDDKIKCLIIGHSMKFNFKFQLTFLGSCYSKGPDIFTC